MGHWHISLASPYTLTHPTPHIRYPLSGPPHTPATSPSSLSIQPPLPSPILLTGGLCQGNALKESLRRYEKLWLPLLVHQHATAGGQRGYSHLTPPLDIALLWHLHRLHPEAYAADCQELRTQSGTHSQTLHVQPQQAFAFSDGSDAAGAATAALWRKAYPNEPFWPPAAPGSQTASFRSHLAADLAAVAVRVPVFTHQLLRAAYVSRPFLCRAVDR